MSAGEAFSSAQEAEIDRAIRAAEMASRFEFSVYFGAVEGDHHSYARRLHAALSSPDRSVLVLVDPSARRLEIVTGSVVRRSLNDDAVRLAAARMRSAFEDGDLVGGIKHGVGQLAESSRQPQSLHES